MDFDHLTLFDHSAVLDSAGNTKVFTGIALFLLISIVLQYTLLPTVVTYGFISLAYVALILLFLSFNVQIEANSTYTKIYLLFTLLVYLRLLFDPTSGNILRLITLLTFTTANIFIIPSILPFSRLLSLTTRVSAILVVVGFFPYIGLPSQFGFIDISLWGADIYWYPSLQPITSIFRNPNQLGGLTFIASLGAINEYFKYNTRYALIFSTINIFGLMMTNYRTGWVMFFTSVLLYITYISYNKNTLILSVLGLLMSIAVGLLMMFNIIPGPHFLTEFSLNGRRIRWIANIQAFLDQPLWGYGFSGIVSFGGEMANPHNSYIRIFTGFGIIGGILYLLITVGTTIRSARLVRSYQGVTLTVLLVGFCILQVFNQLTFIGISMRSTFIAIMIGYSITGEIGNPISNNTQTKLLS